jgi:hypothetical protein
MPEGASPTWWPINPAQQAARNSWAELLDYGGASGGGKTQLLVADSADEYENPWLSAVIIRKQRTDMAELKAVMQEIYRPLGGRHLRGEHAWEFPAGGTCRYGYLKTDAHLDNYQGNPFSFLGIDESGQHPEHRVRALVAWLAAPEWSGLRVRGRFTCNPGGEGYGWQMSVFLRNRCPIHFPAPADDSRPLETSVVPGKVYRGARWTTGESVGFTTAFIPAFLQDNPSYYKAKIKGLMSQSAVLKKQLLDGCWCNAEGIYYDFLQPSPPYVVPIQSVPEEWWWNHFISIDYGYGNSSAAAGMYAVSPLGRVFKTRERDEKKMGSKDFALAICEKGFPATEVAPAQAGWLRKIKDRDPEGPRMIFAVFDCANDAHTGTGKSNYEIMAPIFQEHGIPCVKAGGEAKDSQASAQNLYNGLANGDLVLTSAVPRTYKSLSSRVIDERRAIKKMHGDPLDDVLDETRYGYNTYFDPSAAPANIALDKEIEEMKKRGLDENSLAHYRWRRQTEMDEVERRNAKGIPLRGARAGETRRR